jgi:hypothetical protein
MLLSESTSDNCTLAGLILLTLGLWVGGGWAVRRQGWAIRVGGVLLLLVAAGLSVLLVALWLMYPQPKAHLCHLCHHPHQRPSHILTKSSALKAGLFHA